jgi:NodT family efflux transporter outer membrane factor (OMF) lipoprotein
MWNPSKLALWAACLLMTGCAVGPNFLPPAPPAVDHYTSGLEPTKTIAAEGQVQTFAAGAEVARDWWQLFQSPQLDVVIKEAVAGNRNLQAALARLRQSQENLRAGYGVFFPQFSGSFSSVRQKFSPAQFGTTAQGSTFTLSTATASVSYILDVFGGQRRTVEGLAAQVDYQNYTALAANMTLLGNVANAAVAGAAYQAEIEATEQLIALQQEQVRLTESQSQAGLVPYANVVSLQAQLAATEATLPTLRQNLSKTEHLLASLVGRTPAQWAPPRFKLAEFTLPRDLPVTIPSQLVRQRPDIMAAEAQLHSATANIGVATAAMLPSFTLSGDIGKNITDLTKIFTTAGNFWSFGGGVTQPLFQGGSLWFKRKAAMEAAQASLADYQQVVVSACQQVADTLRALEHDAQLLKAQAASLSSAQQALQLVQANYGAGLVNYTQVIIANSQYQQAKLGYIQAQALRLQDTAALFVALGGGWWGNPAAVGKQYPAPGAKTGKLAVERASMADR